MPRTTYPKILAAHPEREDFIRALQKKKPEASRKTLMNDWYYTKGGKKTPSGFTIDGYQMLYKEYPAREDFIKEALSRNPVLIHKSAGNRWLECKKRTAFVSKKKVEYDKNMKFVVKKVKEFGTPVKVVLTPFVVPPVDLSRIEYFGRMLESSRYYNDKKLAVLQEWYNFMKWDVLNPEQKGKDEFIDETITFFKEVHKKQFTPIIKSTAPPPMDTFKPRVTPTMKKSIKVAEQSYENLLKKQKVWGTQKSVIEKEVLVPYEEIIKKYPKKDDFVREAKKGRKDTKEKSIIRRWQEYNKIKIAKRGPMYPPEEMKELMGFKKLLYEDIVRLKKPKTRSYLLRYGFTTLEVNWLENLGKIDRDE
jgi:hypothetical protein